MCGRTRPAWLQNYLQKISGAKLNVTSENQIASGPRISVGHTKLANEAHLEKSDWKWDTCRMAVQGDVLFLLGRDEADVVSFDPEKENKMAPPEPAKRSFHFWKIFAACAGFSRRPMAN